MDSQNANQLTRRPRDLERASGDSDGREPSIRPVQTDRPLTTRGSSVWGPYGNVEGSNLDDGIWGFGYPA